MNKMEQWIGAVNRLVAGLSGYGQLGECRFRQGDIDGCEHPGYDDSGWKRVMAKSYPIPGIATDTVAGDSGESELELSDWSMVDGPAALRKVIAVPESAHGLQTAGTKIYVTLTMLAPIEIYFDGELAASYRYWGDSRQCEIVVTESFRPGDTHLIVVKTPQNDGDAHLGISLNLDVVEDALLDLTTAVSQLEFARMLCGEGASAEMAEALARLESQLDPAAVDRLDWAALRRNLADIDRALAAFDAAAKEYKVHLIGHAHIDLNWLWDMEDTEEICVRDFGTICDMMDENPDLRFSQSQSAVYDIVGALRPDLLERAKKKIQEGAWDVTAATWTEHDLNTSTGEVFARHNLLATRYAREILGAEPSRICWEPDTFGHPATIPNLLAKAGIRYYYHFRNRQEYPMYWWEGTDGSRVLDFCFGPYNNAIRPNNIMPAVYEFAAKLGMRNSMFVYGVGDHGGGPTRNDIRIKRYLDGKPGLPRLVFATAHEFYDAAIGEKTDFPVLKGEQNFIFEGVYTSKTKIKKYLRDGEARLLDAEALLSMEALQGGAVAEANGRAEEAWKHVLFNGFHDIACGCNIGAADIHDFAIGQEAVDTGKELSGEALAALSGRICGQGDSHVLVANQLGHPRTDVVRVRYGGNASAAVDEDGGITPVQRVGDELVFVASDVPALGYRVYRLCDGGSFHPASVKLGSAKTDGSVHVLETDTYTMKISARTGTVVKLFHKGAGRDILRPLQGEPEVARAFKGEKSSNLLQVSCEEPHIMSAWMMGNVVSSENLLGVPGFEVLECGDVLVRVRISREYGDSRFQQDITLYNGFDRVDFELSADWQELGHYKKGVPFLKVGFTSNIPTPVYTFETPMGWIDRTKQGAELPSLRFVSLYGDGCGLNLYNDSKFGFSVEGSSVYMSVVRSSYSPDAVPDQGPVSCRYALQPYFGEKDIPRVIRGAAAFNHPVAATAAGASKTGGSGGMLTLDGDGVVVSSVKPRADGGGVVVRVVESAGRRVSAVLRLNAPCRAAWEANLAEEPKQGIPLKNGAVEIALRPFENKTILFSL